MVLSNREGEVEEVADWISHNEADVQFIAGSREWVPRLLATVEAYCEIVDRLAHEDRHRKAGEDSSDYLIRLIEQARALLSGQSS